MDTLFLYKADQTNTEEIPSKTIEISAGLPEFRALEAAENCYELQAFYLEDTLRNSLPQAVYDKLIIHMMKRKVSLYRGLI